MSETWTWTRTRSDFNGTTYTEYRGESQYHLATVTNFPSGDSYQGTIRTGGYDQHSPYYKTPAAAKAWCERYGQPSRATRGAR